MVRRRTIIVLAATWFLLGGIPQVAANEAESAAIRSLVARYFAAIAARDIERMEGLWAHEPTVSMLTPGQKRAAFGWPAVRRAFGEGVFSFWNRIDAAPAHAPFVLINAGTATAHFRIDAAGQDRSGKAVRYVIVTEQIFRLSEGQWRLVAAWSSGRPPD